MHFFLIFIIRNLLKQNRIACKLTNSANRVMILLNWYYTSFQKNFRSETPLIIATRMRNARLVKILLAAGADHSIPTVNGSLPLMLASNSGPLVVKEFVNAKVPLNYLDAFGESALTLALRNSEYIVYCERNQYCIIH